MKSTFTMLVGAMTMFGDVWAVYGIGVGVVGRDAAETACAVSYAWSDWKV
jgi:hypothetical protein